MQVVKVTRDYIFSESCTLEVLMEIATKPEAEGGVGMSQDAAEKLAKAALQKASISNGRKSSGIGDLPAPKLRTVIVQKLQDHKDNGQVFKDNALQLEINCLPDLDISKAGANKTKTGPRGTSAPLTGPYKVVKVGVKCTMETDPGKYEIWQHVWTSDSFEQYFHAAPKKAVTKTGRIITAASEIRWAIKAGWIKPVSAEQ